MYIYKQYGNTGEGHVAVPVYDARTGEKSGEDIIARVLPSPDNDQPVIHFVHTMVLASDLDGILKVARDGWKPKVVVEDESEAEALKRRLRELGEAV